LRFLKVIYNRLFAPPEIKVFCKQLKNLLGFYPANPSIFKLAFRHSSSAKDINRSNERLEYLGDAVLDTVISTYLFKKYPRKGEGFLTETRSKIVSRKKLGEIANNLSLQEYLEYNESHVTVSPTIMGNALEALIGAIFLDAGYNQARQFIIYKMVINHIDLEILQHSKYNYKSKLLEWSQKYNRKVEFKLVNQQIVDGNNRLFTVCVHVDGKQISKGKGKNKKNAQKEAAKNAFSTLKISIEELETT